MLVLQADVSPSWIVESVESVPPGRVSDWATATDADGRRRIDIQLREAISPRRPLRVEIFARRPARDKSKNLTAGELVPVVFRHNARGKQLLSLYTAGQGLELSGKVRPHMIRLEDLPAEEQELLTRRPADMSFQCDRRNENVELLICPTVADSSRQSSDGAARHENDWIWKLALQSSYTTDGRARHLVSYDVQHAGRRELRLALSPPSGPRPEDIRGVWIDGRAANYDVLSDEGRRVIAVELPAGAAMSRTTVEWTERGAKLGAWGARSVCPPEPDLPVLARDWTLMIPADCSALSCEVSAENVFHPPLGEGRSRVYFLRRSAARTAATAVFLLVLAMGLLRRETTARKLSIAASVLCAAAALLLPDELLAVALAGVLAAAASLAWRATRRLFVSIDDPATISQSGEGRADGRGAAGEGSTVSMSLPLALLATCLGLLAGNPAQGDDYRVFVPVDAEHRPVGDKVFVPDTLYRELHRAATASSAAPAWLISRAAYRGELARQSAGGRLGIGVLHAQFDLQVFERGASVTLPNRTDDIIGGVLLDGLSVEPSRLAESGKAVLRIDEPGQYRLEYSLRCATRNNGAAGGFEALIPQTPAARLELVLPDAAPPLEIPSALGAVERGDDPRRMTARLGPADRLVVSWPEDAAGASAASRVEAEQLVRLKVHPGSVLAVARFKFHVVEGQLQQVRVALDPRLRVLPMSGDNPPEIRPGAETGQSRELIIRWPRPIANRAVLEVAMLLTGASGVGNISLPKVELIEPRPSGRWMAVDVDESLEHEQQQGETLEPAAAADFLRAWGAAEPAPKSAYRLGEGPIDWSLSTRPRQPRGEARQSLTIVPEGATAEIKYEALYRPKSGYVFQHRARMPKELQIESVSVFEQNVQRVHHWSRDEDGTLTIFLEEPATGEQKITIRGRAGQSVARSWTIRQFRLEQCDLQNVESIPAVGDRPCGESNPATSRIDAAIAWQDDGRFRAAAMLTVEPGDAAAISVRMPPGCELLRAETAPGDGTPRPVDASASENGELTLKASSLGPQRIELAYHGAVMERGSGDRVRLRLPIVKGATVGRTRWLVAPPRGWTIVAADENATFTSWAIDERLRRAAGDADTSAQLVSDDGAAELDLECRRLGGTSRLPAWLTAAAALAVLAATAFYVEKGDRHRCQRCHSQK
jgi:hypothetical protein